MSKSSSLSSDKTLRRQPQQQRGKQRVEKILIAAAEVFAEAGFAAATIQQIADRSNTAVGSIYQFFPDKLAIFLLRILTSHSPKVLVTISMPMRSISSSRFLAVSLCSIT
jgi:hypothetical protein